MIEGVLTRRHSPAHYARGRAWQLIRAGMFALLLIAGTATAQEASEPLSQSPAEGQTILGDVIPMGDGTARSWVQVDGDGNPSAVGITLSEAALEGLPTELTPGLIWTEFVLSLPSELAGLPYNHIAVNWNPKGHPPVDIYGTPHFDFHFYMISLEERSQITARGEDLERCNRPPAEGQIADGYIFAPDSEEPGMGGHWVDADAHELHGEPFSTTFIYGTYDGEVIFWEPMITMEYLKSRPDVVLPLKLPQEYAQEGHYPTNYSVRYDPERKEYTVALESMELQPISAAHRSSP